MDRPTFLHHLRRSQLLTEEQIEQAAAAVPGNEAKPLARALVMAGLLSRFQAEALLAGKTKGFLLGSYRIMDQIGRGGMGKVFVAVHTTMDRKVAIKLIKPRSEEDRQEIEFFQREVRAAAQLHHPHIVTAYDANEAGGVHYLVMEYVDGPDLARLVRKQGPLPVDLACMLMHQAAQALQYAHDKGVVHRDIKPANLLVANLQRERSVGSTPMLKILDFGLARLRDVKVATVDAPPTIVTQGGVVFGTPDYISPEQAQDAHAVDSRCDLYSLGCSFYFLLTGRVPFAGNSPMEKLVKHLTEAPEPLSDLRPDVPESVVALVHRLMAKKPEDRFPTGAELADALAPYCGTGAGYASAVPTHTGFSVKTPSGSDPDFAADWIFDEPAPEPEALSTLEIDAAPTSPLHELRRRRRQRAQSSRLWLALGILFSLLLIAILFMLLWRR